MKYFAALSPMKDEQKSAEYRAEHLEFLKAQAEAGRVLMNGRFTDGAGGLVIYQADSLEEVQGIVKEDPYVVNGARDVEIHEWDMQTTYTFEK